MRLYLSSFRMGNHPESAAIEQVVQYFIDHHILFKALRDGEAIVVNGDQEKVVS